MHENGSDIFRVLKYLREMVEYCHESRRRDLAWQYESAVELVAQRTFGKLPPREPVKYPVPLPEPRVLTIGQMQMLSRPYQKVIRHVTVTEDGYDFTYEELACGHLVRAFKGDPLGNRRRCAECAADNIAAKKKPASVAVATVNQNSKRRSSLCN
jgi:hypothetical protein